MSEIDAAILAGSLRERGFRPKIVLGEGVSRFLYEP